MTLLHRGSSILRLMLCLICIQSSGMIFATPTQVPVRSIAIGNLTGFPISFQVLNPGAHSWTNVTLAPGDYPILSSFSCLRISTGQPASTHYYAVLAGGRYAFTVEGHDFMLRTNGGDQSNPVPQTNESDHACVLAP
jgi:hypothetical protein